MYKRFLNIDYLENKLKHKEEEKLSSDLMIVNTTEKCIDTYIYLLIFLDLSVEIVEEDKIPKLSIPELNTEMESNRLYFNILRY